MIKRLLALLLVVLAAVGLCACENPLCTCGGNPTPDENYNVPEQSSLLTYELSNGDVITLLYASEEMCYGEWVRADSSVVRVRVKTEGNKNSCMIHGSKTLGKVWMLYEIEGICKALPGGEEELSFLEKDSFLKSGLLAEMSAGLLNTDAMTMNKTAERVTVESFREEPTDIDCWDWTDPTWSTFIQYDENTRYTLSNSLTLEYNPWRNMGTMTIDEAKIPVCFVFHEKTMTVEVYDMSDHMSRWIAVFYGQMDGGSDNRFLIEKVYCPAFGTYNSYLKGLAGSTIYRTGNTYN